MIIFDQNTTLNGWQRLWIVYSAVVALFIGVMTYQDWPPMSLGFKEIVYEAKGQYYDFAELPDQAMIKEKVEEFLNEKLSETDAPKLTYLTTQAGKRIEGAEANLLLQQSINVHRKTVTDKRIESLIKSLLAFFTLSVGLYLLGWSFGWVYKGFVRGKM